MAKFFGGKFFGGGFFGVIAGDAGQAPPTATVSISSGGAVRRKRKRSFIGTPDLPPQAYASIEAALEDCTLEAVASMGESPVARRRRIGIKAALLS